LVGRSETRGIETSKVKLCRRSEKEKRKRGTKLPHMGGIARAGEGKNRGGGGGGGGGGGREAVSNVVNGRGPNKESESVKKKLTDPGIKAVLPKESKSTFSKPTRKRDP